MEKFKTLNNSRARDIVISACRGKGRSVFLQLYHAYDLFTDELYQRVFSLVMEICPLTMEIYKTLPYDVQNFFNQLWLSLSSSPKK